MGAPSGNISLWVVSVGPKDRLREGTGKAAMQSQAPGLELGLVLTCSQIVWPGCGHQRPIWVHPVLSKLAATRSRTLKGQKREGDAPEKTVSLEMSVSVHVFSVCVGHICPHLPHFSSLTLPEHLSLSVYVSIFFPSYKKSQKVDQKGIL